MRTHAATVVAAALCSVLGSVLGSSSLAGCATARPADPPPPAAAPAPQADVEALHERVSRLERRLADLDAKLSMVAQRRPREGKDAGELRDRALARRDGDTISSGDPRPPAKEASIGALASIDLPERKSPYADDAPPAPAQPLEDDGATVVIQMAGDGARPQAPEPREAADPGLPVGLSVEDMYAWSQARLKEGKLLVAMAGFEDIAARAPQHDLADNAQYWIGYCHQAGGNHRVAVDEWARLAKRYPKSAKVPDALFGMAVSHEALGEPAVAEALYAQLVSQHPKAEKVREAKKALQRLRPR